MTDEQIEQAAQRYSELHFIDEARIISTERWDKARVHFAKTLAGFAKHCLAHQWINVDERLPEDDTMVTAHSPNGRIDVLRYHDGEFIDELHQAHCVDYFIPVPPLNTDKEER